MTGPTREKLVRFDGGPITAGDVESLRPRLTALACRIVDGDAEDVVQEAIMRLGCAEVRNRPMPEVAAWLSRVTLNLAINRRRDVERWRERGRRGAAGVADSAPDEPEGVLLRNERREEVRSVLATLPIKQQMVLHLRYSDHSYAEIAQAVGLSVSSVGTTLARAEAAFRAAFLKENP